MQLRPFQQIAIDVADLVSVVKIIIRMRLICALKLKMHQCGLTFATVIKPAVY